MLNDALEVTNFATNYEGQKRYNLGLQVQLAAEKIEQTLDFEINPTSKSPRKIKMLNLSMAIQF